MPDIYAGLKQAPPVEAPPIPPPVTALSLLRQIQRYFGPNGEMWIKGSYREDGGFVDVSGALMDAKRWALQSKHATASTQAIFDASNEAYNAILDVAETPERRFLSLSCWNDDPSTNWKAVKKALKDATKKLSEKNTTGQAPASQV